MKRGLNLFTFFGFLAALMAASEPLCALEPGATAQSPTPDKHSKNVVSLLAGPAFVSYRLRGTGFNATLPLTSGTTFGIGGSREISTSCQLQTRFVKTGAEFSSLTGLSPSTVSLNQYSFEFGVSYDPQFTGLAEGIRLEIGYAAQWSRGTVTSPNSVIAANDAMGPILGLSYDLPLPVWKFRSRFNIWFPNWFRETLVKTGSLENSIRFNWSIEAGYYFSQTVSAFVGPTFILEKQSFGGTGNRGVSEAGQTLFSVLFPIRVEVHF